MNDLERYFANNPGRLVHKWRHYFDIYERHFSRFRGTNVQLVEFGVAHGGSLQMWKHYFGPQARIVGVDINPACAVLAEPQVEIVIGDQDDVAFLSALADRLQRIDILIDDGGHTMSQQRHTFDVFFPRVHDTGVYLCEDVHTSYRANWGGGYRAAGSFVEWTKELIDALHAWHSEDPTLTPTDFTRTATSLHVYDSIVVIEKGPHAAPEQVQSGRPSFGSGAPLTTRVRGRIATVMAPGASRSEPDR